MSTAGQFEVRIGATWSGMATRLSSTSLRVELPSGLPVGTHEVIVATPTGGSVNVPGGLVVSLVNGGAGGSGGAGGHAGAGGNSGPGGNASAGGNGGGGDVWDDAGATRRVALTFDNALRPVDLVDFPVLVVVDQGRIEYAETSSEGVDLRFYDLDGTLLDHEIELWDPVGRSYVWVRVPQIDASSGVDGIWVYYGSANTTDVQNAPGVWSAGYRAVWHLGEIVDDEATVGTHRDATGNGNVGQQVRGDDIDDASGSIGRAHVFDGFGDRIVVEPVGLQPSGNHLTMQARALVTGQLSPFPHVLGGGSDGRYWQMFWYSGRAWGGRYRVDGVQHPIFTDAGALDQWATVAIVYDGAAARLYLDGVEIGQSAVAGAVAQLNTQLWIGGNPVLWPRDFEGVIDEVRIAEVARSPEWIDAQHASLTDTLVGFGPTEAQ